MTTATEVDLQRKYTKEERNTMFVAYAEACGRGDREEAERILEKYPLNPRWAKIILEVMGREHLLENYNITYATEYFGEGWMDGKSSASKITGKTSWAIPTSANSFPHASR